MELFYSKVKPDKLLHIVYRVDDFYKMQNKKRQNIVEEKEFIQLSAMKLKKK